MAEPRGEAKRGRLSSFDLQPEEAWPHIQKAIAELGARRREAEAIRQELNLHLSGIAGASPISSSAFNRKSLQIAKIGRDIAMAREMAAVFAEKVNDMPEGDVGMLINEMCKVIVYNMTADIAAMDLEASAKMMKEISLTVYRLEQAGQISHKRRAAIMDRAKAEATEAVKTVAKERGVSAETVEAILKQVLVNPQAPAARDGAA